MITRMVTFVEGLKLIGARTLQSSASFLNFFLLLLLSTTQLAKLCLSLDLLKLTDLTSIIQSFPESLIILLNCDQFRPRFTHITLKLFDLHLLFLELSLVASLSRFFLQVPTKRGVLLPRSVSHTLDALDWRLTFRWSISFTHECCFGRVATPGLRCPGSVFIADLVCVETI